MATEMKHEIEIGFVQRLCRDCRVGTSIPVTRIRVAGRKFSKGKRTRIRKEMSVIKVL